VVLLAFSTLLAGGLPGSAPVEAQEPPPFFFVEPESGLVGGGGWLQDATVTVLIGDPDDPDETQTASVFDDGWFMVGVGSQIEPGMLVTVTDGTTTKDYVVFPLTLDLDIATGMVTGTTAPGETVRITVLEWPDGPGGPSGIHEELVQADAEGDFAADLAASDIELHERHSVIANVADDTGDSTQVARAVVEPSPQIQVYPEIDEVRGLGFPGRTAEIAVDGVQVATADIDTFGDFRTVVDIDLEPGQVVRVTAGDVAPEHEILPLAILAIDIETNVVSGVGEPLYWTLAGRLPSHDEPPSHLRGTNAAADGTWSIDFSDEQADNPLGEALDIEPGMLMSAGQFDDAGHLTGVFRIATAAEPDPVDPDPVDPDPVDPDPIVGVCPAPRATSAFSDVPVDNVHRHNIDCAAFHEIALGYPDGTYRPANGVQRDQMASFIVRTLEAAGHTLPAAEHTFTDIAGNTHERAIGQLAAADIVRGRTATTYAPAGTVTRDQMASYLVRALDWALDTTHTAPASPFTDVAGNTHEQAIHTAYDLELTTGRTATTYEPRMDVRRDQMASFLIRLLPQAMTAD
jgi:hypothetical protein